MASNQNKTTLLNSSMKMADFVLENYELLTVLPRFGVQLGFGEKSVKEVCAAKGIDSEFFTMICNIHAFEEYLPTDVDIQSIAIDDLISYLSNSHNYYINKRILAIEQRMEQLGECCSENHYSIVRRFFNDYKTEVLNHFEYEDSVVFPYIKAVEAGVAKSDYHIEQYEHNHSNIDDKLSDLKNIIIKYLPATCSNDTQNELLREIFVFEHELMHHTCIENKVLIPIVQLLESRAL